MFDRLRQAYRDFDIRTSSWFTVEFFRTIPFILLAILMFYPDWSTLLVVKYVFGFLFVIGLISHFIRKVLFPYVSLGKYTEKALENPISASIVFLGFCLVICTIMLVAASFFK